MSTTLKDILKAVENFTTSIPTKTQKGIADRFLGKFKGIIPKGKNSTQYIKELRSTLYGKIK